MRSRLLFLVLGLILGVVATAGVWGTTELRTTLESVGSHGGVAPTGIQPNKTYTAHVGSVCVDGNAEVTIDRVRAGHTYSYAKVGKYALGSLTTAIGDVRRTSADRYFRSVYSDPDPQTTVATRCGDFRNVVEVAVEVEAASLPAAIDGFVIEYRVHGVRKTVRSDFFVMMCSGKETADNDFAPEEFPEDSNLSSCREWIDR